MDQGELSSSPDSYRRLVAKFNYLTIICPNISFIISVISKFMFASCSTHMEAALRIVQYLKAHPSRGLFCGVHGHLCIEAFIGSNWARSPSDRRSTTRFCTFLGGNLVT